MDSNQKLKIKKVFYIVIVLIAISALVLIFVNYQKSKMIKRELSQEEKMKILDEFSKDLGPAISDKEKAGILEEFGADAANNPPLSEEQKQKILESFVQ